MRKDPYIKLDLVLKLPLTYLQSSTISDGISSNLLLAIFNSTRLRILQMARGNVFKSLLAKFKLHKLWNLKIMLEKYFNNSINFSGVRFRKTFSIKYKT